MKGLRFAQLISGVSLVAMLGMFDPASVAAAAPAGAAAIAPAADSLSVIEPAARAVRGRAVVVGPRGGVAVGRGAVVGPRGGVAVGRAAVVRPYRPWARRAYYGTLVGGVALGAIIAATAVPAAPAAGLCWFWADPSRTQGYWDYCRPR